MKEEKRSYTQKVKSINNEMKKILKSSKSIQEIDSLPSNCRAILDYLIENNDQIVYQKDLEQHFSITKGTMSKVLTMLEANNLIKRQFVREDARYKRIVATPIAYERYTSMGKEISNIENCMLIGFTNEERNALYRYLLKMEENLKTESSRRNSSQ